VCGLVYRRWVLASSKHRLQLANMTPFSKPLTLFLLGLVGNTSIICFCKPCSFVDTSLELQRDAPRWDWLHAYCQYQESETNFSLLGPQPRPQFLFLRPWTWFIDHNSTWNKKNSMEEQWCWCSNFDYLSIWIWFLTQICDLDKLRTIMLQFQIIRCWVISISLMKKVLLWSPQSSRHQKSLGYRQKRRQCQQPP